jgi:hypothetical protein
MRPGDVFVVAAMHREGMGRSLWARLGLEFLETVYRAIVARPEFIGFVYEVPDGRGDARIRGFIAGSENPRRMMTGALMTAGRRLIAAALRGAARSPSLWWQLVTTPFYFLKSRVDRTGAEAAAVPAESLFCYFEEDLRGKRISGLINKFLFDELAFRGHRRVKITTEADNEGANRQLASWGFADRGTFRFYGKTMRAYVLDLGDSDRVEPVARWYPFRPGGR